jgi:hypothetical protein
MAVRKQTIPPKDADFNLAQAVIAKKTIANVSLWNLDRQWVMDVFTPASQEWDVAWENYKDPITRTPLSTFEKDKAREKYEALLRFLVQTLEYNVLITDNELAEMNIRRKSHKRTPAPKPNSEPGCIAKGKENRVISFDVFDRVTGKRAKPEGVHGAEFRWAKLIAPPKNVDELVNSEFYTKSPFTKEFKESERGEIIYFCLRWENTRGEKGPWGNILSANIP